MGRTGSEGSCSDLTGASGGTSLRPPLMTRIAFIFGLSRDPLMKSTRNEPSKAESSPCGKDKLQIILQLATCSRIRKTTWLYKTVAGHLAYVLSPCQPA